MLATALAVGGCGSGDVWVGQLQEGLNLDACAGTTCAGTSPRELATPEPEVCEGPLGAELIVDLSVEIPEPECPMNGSCYYNLRDFEVAQDGSSWVLGRMDFFSDDPSELWATHFSSEGELLGNRKVATGVSFNGGSVAQNGDLAVDARGHAFVLVYQLDPGPNADAPWAGQSWLTELDAEGEEVEGPIPLAGIAAGKLAVRSDGSVVLAANALLDEPHSIVAALTGKGERMWSRADLSTADYGPSGAIDGIATESGGAALVLAKRRRFPAGENNDYIFGLTRFDETGDATWDVVIDRHLAFAALASGSDGGAVITGQTVDFRHWMGYVHADGTAAWVHELTGGGGPAVIDAERERVYALSSTDTGTTELNSIALDGESCERLTVPDSTPAGYLQLDGQGRLYVVGQPGFTLQLARLRLPDE